MPDHNLWTLKQGDIFTAKQIDFVIEQFNIAEVVDAQGNLTLGVKPQHRINNVLHAKIGKFMYQYRVMIELSIILEVFGLDYLSQLL